MSNYTAEIRWKRGAQKFTDNRYSRAHSWKFDGGIEVPASSSPAVVPRPMSIDAAVDPEEAFLASLASCHMLWFLSLAAKQGSVVDEYADEPVGALEKNADGRLAFVRITLRPSTRFGGANLPDRSQLTALHHAAHEACFLANSVRTEIRCESRDAAG